MTNIETHIISWLTILFSIWLLGMLLKLIHHRPIKEGERLKAILHTNGLEYEDCSVDNKEFELWQNIYHLIDGEEALIARENDDEYTLISLINPDENKKFHWLLGQDAELGSYINDYKHFEDDWDNGNYSFDSFIILNKRNVELIHERGK